MFTKTINQMPNDVSLSSRKQSQGYINDLTKKEKFELEELLERQNKLLTKNLLSVLPDKGEKIKIFREKILQELERKNEIEKAANLLSRLNIACEGKAIVTKMEWTGKYDKNENVSEVAELDSDDDEDPLKILAQPTGTGVHKKKIIHISEESAIKPEDIEEIKSFETQHVKYIINKTKNCPNKKEPFKPYKTTKTNVHDPIKEKQRKLPITWEVTAATPPIIVHGAIKVLSLNESLSLLQKQTEKQKIIQEKYAQECLANRLGMNIHDSTINGKNFSNYRVSTNDASSFSSDNEENEVNKDDDDDDDDKL